MFVQRWRYLGLKVVAFVLGLFAIGSGAVCAQDQQGDRGLLGELSAILNKQADHWNKSDLEGFMDAYWRSDELTFSAGGNTTRGWQATLDRYKKTYGAKPDMGKLHFTDLEVVTLGSDAALMLGRWHLTMSDGNAEGNFSLVWKKLDKHWKIIHDHSSSYEPEKTDSKPEAAKSSKAK